MGNKIVGFEKFSIVDFEGHMSAVIFTGTCNFKCPFCHNKDLVINSETLDEFTEEEILAHLKRRIGLLDACVISGGEPTLYNNLEPLIDKIKEMGYLVKLDTNGTNPIILKHLIDTKKIDYVAMDIKNSLEMYPLTIDSNNLKLLDNVKESINILLNGEIDYEFRTTLVNELHNIDSIKEMGKLINGAKRLYLQKFVDHGSCIKEGLHEVSYNDTVKFKDELSKYVKDVYLRGY